MQRITRLHFRGVGQENCQQKKVKDLGNWLCSHAGSGEEIQVVSAIALLYAFLALQSSEKQQTDGPMQEFQNKRNRLCGSGAVRPSRRIPSSENSMASRMWRSTSSLVWPVQTQPGKSGEYVEYPGFFDTIKSLFHRLSPACFSKQKGRDCSRPCEISNLKFQIASPSTTELSSHATERCVSGLSR